jgi:glyoxylase-like metal-dependent hydrolase (beta-lactamase superfamily II)
MQTQFETPSGMKIKTFVLNPIRENTYVVWDDSGECIFVDAGCCNERENERVAEFVAEQKLRPVALVNTHGHFDHVAGNAFLCTHYGIDAQLHQADLFCYEHAAEYSRNFNLHIAPPPAPKFLGSELKFGHSTLQVLHTPGHSKGSVSLYSREAGVVFTGDTLFKGSVGRTDFTDGNLNELMQSLHLVLLALPDLTSVLPGHGFASSIGSERWNNPFLVNSE